MVLFTYIIFFNLVKFFINNDYVLITNLTLNISQKIHYNKLFNSIDSDSYNLSEIYNKSYNSIKIKYKTLNNKLKKDICIFGVLANEKGLNTEKAMLKWLLPEYNVYCIYQKFPGELFEYPALRFAQWFSLSFNISIILYVHTKGAFNQFKSQEQLIELWKYEFTSPRKYIYINLIKKNSSDVTCLFKNKNYTVFNAFFISIRAFKLLKTILINKDRYFFERLFLIYEHIRVKGILNNSIPWYDARNQIPILLNKYKIDKQKNVIFFLFMSVDLFIIYYIKKLRLKNIKFH